MKRAAVLLTVYNRREVTLQGLRLLSQAIAYLCKERQEDDFQFDIFMTDDGCTDGTGDAVRKEFPKIRIVQGDGKLYWNQGMRKAWQAAIDSKISYDFYLWFNDDVALYENGLVTLFDISKNNGNMTIISGAFCDDNGIVSYGGWKDNILAVPNGQLQQVEKINGNLVLIPKVVFDKIGVLDEHFRHSYGDWEYGCRAKRAGVQLIISPLYIGVCNRHDALRKCFDANVPLCDRFKNLYSPNSVCPADLFYYNVRCNSFLIALKSIISVHVKTLFPHV